MGNISSKNIFSPGNRPQASSLNRLAPETKLDNENESEENECPICFCCYVALNEAKCCRGKICTSCHLNIVAAKPSRSPRRNMECPFCTSSSYSVECIQVVTVDNTSPHISSSPRKKDSPIVLASVSDRQSIENEIKSQRNSSASSSSGLFRDAMSGRSSGDGGQSFRPSTGSRVEDRSRSSRNEGDELERLLHSLFLGVSRPSSSGELARGTPIRFVTRMGDMPSGGRGTMSVRQELETTPSRRTLATRPMTANDALDFGVSSLAMGDFDDVDDRAAQELEELMLREAIQLSLQELAPVPPPAALPPSSTPAAPREGSAIGAAGGSHAQDGQSDVHYIEGGGYRYGEGAEGNEGEGEDDDEGEEGELDAVFSGSDVGR